METIIDSLKDVKTLINLATAIIVAGTGFVVTLKGLKIRGLKKNNENITKQLTEIREILDKANAYTEKANYLKSLKFKIQKTGYSILANNEYDSTIESMIIQGTNKATNFFEWIYELDYTSNYSNYVKMQAVSLL